MARACVLLAPGFEEIEAITIIDVLRRAEVETVTLAVSDNPVEGAHGIAVRADASLETAGGEWDAVILPGGMPGSTNLRDDPRVQALVRKQHARGGICAAICAAPIALAKAGVLAGKKATSYPGFRDELGCAYLEDRVVIDGNVVTSRGPATAMEFALRLAALLGAPDKAARVAQGMLTAL